MATVVVAGIIVVWTLVASAAAMLIGGVIQRADRERPVVMEPAGSTLVGARSGQAPRVR